MSQTEALFDVVVTGHRTDKNISTLVAEVQALLKDNSPQLEFKLSDALLFEGKSSPIRENLNIQTAKALVQHLHHLGINGQIRPALQIVPKAPETAAVSADVYTCPACGHQQPKRPQSHDGRLESCEKCGIVGERYQRKTRLNEAMQTQQQKHNLNRDKQLAEALRLAKIKEEAMLQEEAKRRLGLLDDSKPHLGIKIAAAVAAISITIGILYYLNQPTAEELATQQATGQAPQANGLAKAIKNVLAQIKAAAGSSENGEGIDITALTGQGNAAVPDENTKTTQKPEPLPPEAIATAIGNEEWKTLLPARFQMPLPEFQQQVQRLREHLTAQQTEQADALIAQTAETYPRVLLLLEMTEWQLQHQQRDMASLNIVLIQAELGKATDAPTQALVTGALSKAHALFEEWKDSEQFQQQAIANAKTLPQAAEQVALLTRLANEQALFASPLAAQNLLANAQTIAETLPVSTDTRSNAFAQIAASHVLLAAYPAAQRLLSQVENQETRQKLVKFITSQQSPPPKTVVSNNSPPLTPRMVLPMQILQTGFGNMGIDLRG